MKPLYFVGLDLGQAQQYTAIATLERTTVPDPESPNREVRHYAVRHLQRFPLGTPYTEVCARLVEMFSVAPLSGTTLIVDQTAVGKPVVQMLRRSRINARIRTIALTSGQKATGMGVRLVPRKELVSTLQVLLQSEQWQCSQPRSLWTFLGTSCNISVGSTPAGQLASAVPHSNTRRSNMRQDDERMSPFFRIRTVP